MSFSADERGQFARLADVLIPADERMPSASTAGVASQWLDAVLAARPDLADPLHDLLRKTEGREPEDAVNNLRESDPAAFGVLAEVAAGAYFMNPTVRELIGYSGQAPRPIDPRADYMEDGLLESVIRRGPIYRPTPR